MNNSSGKSDQNISAQDQSMFGFRPQVVITAAVFIIAFIGNTFVIAVVKRKTKGPINDLFIVNLSLSDILFVGVCLINYIFLALKSGLFYCTAIRPLPTIAFCASIFTMTSMAVIKMSDHVLSAQAKSAKTKSLLLDRHYLAVVIDYQFTNLACCHGYITGKMPRKMAVGEIQRRIHHRFLVIKGHFAADHYNKCLRENRIVSNEEQTSTNLLK